MQVARNNSLSASFPAGSPPQAVMYANSPHGHNHGLMAAPGFNRSFSDMNGFPQHSMEKPQIYTV
jgi:regulatory protein SWI6